MGSFSFAVWPPCYQSTCGICPLRSLSNCLQLNRVYDSWRALAYPSLKPLGAWFQDLLSRMQQLVEWTNDRTLWLNKLVDGSRPAAFLESYQIYTLYTVILRFPHQLLTRTLHICWMHCAKTHCWSGGLCPLNTLSLDYSPARCDLVDLACSPWSI